MCPIRNIQRKRPVAAMKYFFDKELRKKEFGLVVLMDVLYHLTEIRCKCT